MYIGTTECGDPGLVFDWVNNLQPANIIITKNLNDTLIQHILTHQKQIILHVTCTGYGGTKLEPNVPDYHWTFNQVQKLISLGFPKEQLVLRIDPIIPTHLSRTLKVLELFEGTIKRCRYSFLDMYPHVLTRFKTAHIRIPYTSFNAPKEVQQTALEAISKFDYDFESCAEFTPHKLGCASKKDLQILGITDYVPPQNARKQRYSCSCLPKKQLLPFGTKCAHKCLYCFWKD